MQAYNVYILHQRLAVIKHDNLNKNNNILCHSEYEIYMAEYTLITTVFTIHVW